MAKQSRITSVDIIDYYGDRLICDHCGAKISTYGDTCNVLLDVRCEGFNAIEMMLSTVAEKRALAKAVPHAD